MFKKPFLLGVAFLFALFANGNAQIPFSRHIAGDNIPYVHITFPVDLDRDGDVDIIGGSGLDTHKVFWLENLGSGNFTFHQVDAMANGVSNSGVYACDLNGDGHIDIIASLTKPAGPVSDNEVAWYENDGHQGFTKHRIYSFGQPDYVFATDLDDDGDNDVFATFWGIPDMGRAVWFENDGFGNFTPHIIVDNYRMGRSIIAADFDGDGDKDVVTIAAYLNARMEWWKNDGSENFTHHFIESGIDCIELETHDFNDDGIPDLLYTSVSYSNPQIAWLTWQGSNPTKHLIEPVRAYGSCAADLDHDGDLDIIANHHGYNQSYYYLKTPGAYSKYLLDANNGGGTFLSAADFDNDGDADLALPGHNAGKIYWYENLLNRPPVANAGPDQIVEATSPAGADVTLDGSGSSDPDNDPLTYTWRENGSVIATDQTSEITLALGIHTIVLTVNDGKGGTDTDEVIVNVVDTTPPTITVALNPNALWPPNHKLVDIHATVTVSDVADTHPTFVLSSIVSNEPDNGLGDGDKPNDIQEAALGTPDVDFKLRAERSGKGDGRIYTVTYTASDVSGNSANASATVTVPHDMGKATAFAEETAIPEDFVLLQNLPNPLRVSVFNPETEIRFALPEASHVVLAIYDVTGRKIRTLMDEQFSAGHYRVRWDGKDNYGKLVASGVYLYQLHAGNFSQVRKMSLLR